ncbi:hypothetical protein Glove_30g3 [Diversispora epigaea]|uniref:ribonuclease H n=1 Tax=Diversispora epigaea TaxID=1348612 RepID=A0A397JIK3_9GLOM|nr:hypothetical protein Glove_30g3 [Diversispora epigaea]
MVTIPHSTGPIIGKVTRERKDNEQQITIRHYLNEIEQDKTRSPLIACEGCTLKEPIIEGPLSNRVETTLQYCSIPANIKNISYLPTRYSAYSVSKAEDKRRKLRTVISPNSLVTYHNNLPKTIQYKSLDHHIDNLTFLENIIESDGETIGYMRNIIQRYKNLEVYTDGSLKKSIRQNVPLGQQTMGFGVVCIIHVVKTIELICITNDTVPQQFTWKGKIEGPPSSTRAELWGILSIIWVASHKSTIKIYTDSESSIKSITGYMNGRKGKHWSNYSNPIILQTIKELILTKELIVDLEKIAAHQGHQYNEQADQLAKEGADSMSIFTINMEYIKSQQFHFKWNNTDIDAGIHQELNINVLRTRTHRSNFIKKKSEVETVTSWFTQHRIYNWLNRNIRNETNWQLSAQIWHNTKITNTVTNSKDSSSRAFSLKLLNEELPTMSNLNLRKSEIYKEKTCTFCNKYKETNTHVFMCGDQGKILKIAFRSVIKKLYFNEKGNQGLSDLMEKINRGHFMKINHNREVMGTQPTDRFEFNDLARGLIPNSIYKLIRSKVSSTEVTHQGHQYNEQADQLAKEGADSMSIFTINMEYIKSQQFHFKWNNTDIDAGIKDFIKKKSEVETVTSWFTQHRIYNWLNRNIRNETNWQLSAQIWHNTKITNTVTNSKDSSSRAFSLKLLNEELPTMSNLNLRKSEIYKEKTCPFCNKYKETNTHVFMCGDQGKILKTAFRSVIKKLYFNEKGNQGLSDLMEKINRGHFMKINHNREVMGTQPTDRFEFNDLARGLIPNSIYKLIRSKVSSTEVSRNMVLNIFWEWKTLLYNRWKTRCKEFLVWEDQNKIKESDKRSKGKRAYINPEYLEEKKQLITIAKNIVNYTIDSLYRFNYNVLSNINFCLDLGGAVASQ